MSNYFVELIRPTNREKEYGFQINSRKPCWSFFVWLDFTKRNYKYPRPFFNLEVCEHYGPQLKLGKLHLQFTTWEQLNEKNTKL